MPHATFDDKAFDRQHEPIAIVGMSCTLAGGVDSPAALWQTLLNKEIKQSAKIPESRFNIDAYFHQNAFGRPAAIGSRGGFFLDTPLHAFDAEFFGYEADEAKHMDPQHFRVLESVYECLESAGQTFDSVRGTNTAVYIGNFSLDRVISSARHSYDDRHLHEVIGIDPGLLSSRVSYCFDMNGPVFTTNTGCTSSLFALHTAALALRGGQCTAALVGGVNLLQGPEAYSSYSKFGIMSPDSMCHTFDARCNGYVRAEGVGTLYVKLLSDALRDNDPIRGVIRSIAVNSNGFVPGMPLFVPNQKGLTSSIDLAYEQAELDKNETAYVETHGIGMILGEIAEGHAVGTAMNSSGRRKGPVLLGSLKPNFGHQEAASGIFVIQKGALMTEAGVIPGHADFEIPHPAIDFEKLNIKPQTDTIPWPVEYSSRRMGLSSYGWSGTNAHILVESVHTLAPDYQLGRTRDLVDYDHHTTRPLLLVFSTHKSSLLPGWILKHQKVVDQYFAADFAYTVNIRRSTFDHRAFTVVKDGSASTTLANSAITYGSMAVARATPSIKFSFADRDVDLSNVAHECWNCFPSFRKSFEKLDKLISAIGVDGSLERVFKERTIESMSPQLRTVHNAAVQIGLLELLASWNITPDLVTQGSIVSQYATGQVSAAEALIHEWTGGNAANATDLTALDWRLEKTETTQPEETVLFDLGHGITGLSGLLAAIGQLYLSGVHLDLEKVNQTEDADWKPSVLVDLPHYEWDHSVSYSSETYANAEHRLNKFPYHDILGRKVHGLSPGMMVWKNKLSFNDLPDQIPWVPNAKPRKVLGIPHFLSGIVEALAQAFGDEKFTECVISDFELLLPLSYEADVDLIEVQTSISRISGSSIKPSGRALYHASVEAVREGEWTTHCEATILVGCARTDSPVSGLPAGHAIVPLSELGNDKIRQIPVSLQACFPEPTPLCAYLLHPNIIQECLRNATHQQMEVQTDNRPSECTRLKEVRVLQALKEAKNEYTVNIPVAEENAAPPEGGHDLDLVDARGQLILALRGIS